MNFESIKDVLENAYFAKISTSVVTIKKVNSKFIVEAESHLSAEYPKQCINLAIERFLWLTDRKSNPNYNHENHEQYLYE